MDERNYIHFEEKDLRSLYKQNKSISEYKNDVINNTMSFLDKIWISFFDDHLFDSYRI